MRRLLLVVVCLVFVSTAAARTTSSIEVTGLKVATTTEQAHLTWSVTSTTNLLQFLIEEREGPGAWVKLAYLPASAREATLKEPAGGLALRVWAVPKVGVREWMGTITGKPVEEPKEEPPVEGKEQTAWGPAGAFVLTDKQAAERVVRKTEVVPGNQTANRFLPSEAEVTAAHATRNQYGETLTQWNPLAVNVTGRLAAYLSNPTTDEVIQWVAAKYSIPVDWLRAEYRQESGLWNQQALGDFRAGSDPKCAPAYAVTGSGVYESLGIPQVKHRCDESVGTGSNPLRYLSTAFAADYQAATVRYYYDGHCGWCSFNYTSQQWQSISAWFSPGSYSSGAQEYVAAVQKHLAARDWPKA